jgi:hypothetical protein
MVYLVYGDRKIERGRSRIVGKGLGLGVVVSVCE